MVNIEINAETYCACYIHCNENVASAYTVHMPHQCVNTETHFITDYVKAHVTEILGILCELHD